MDGAGPKFFLCLDRIGHRVDRGGGPSDATGWYQFAMAGGRISVVSMVAQIFWYMLWESATTRIRSTRPQKPRKGCVGAKLVTIISFVRRPGMAE